MRTKRTEASAPARPSAARSMLLGRLGRASAWLLLLSGPVLGLIAWRSAGSADAAASQTAFPAPASAPAADALGPAAFAELYVATWLSAGEGQEAQLRPFGSRDVALEEMRPGSRYATRTAALSATEVRPGEWHVLVAADVVRVVKSQAQQEGLQYFRVSVVSRAGDAGSGWAVLALPALVSAPQLPEPKLAYTGGPVTQTVNDAVLNFLKNYLTKSDELERYVTPGSALRPVRPAPYEGVSITGIQAQGEVPRGSLTDGQVVAVLATVTAYDAQEVPVRLEYPLTLKARAGRWEVVAIGTVRVEDPGTTTPASAPAASSDPAPTGR